MNLNNKKIGVVGVGYVGLPLAIEFGKKYKTVAYDINVKRIVKLKNNIDVSGEISKNDFKIDEYFSLIISILT